MDPHYVVDPPASYEAVSDFDTQHISNEYPDDAPYPTPQNGSDSISNDPQETDITTFPSVQPNPTQRSIHGSTMGPNIPLLQQPNAPALYSSHAPKQSGRRSHSLAAKPHIIVTQPNPTQPALSRLSTGSKSSAASSTSPGEAKSSWFVQCCGRMCLQGWLAFVGLIVALRAIIVRMGFICFTCTAIVTVVMEKKDGRFWLLCITTIPLLIELIFAIKSQMERGKTGASISKWFSLCNFAYLICACPPIWIIELHHMDQLNNATVAMKLQALANHTTTLVPQMTTPSWLPSRQMRLPKNESMMIMGKDIEDYLLSNEFFDEHANPRLRRIRRDMAQLGTLQLKDFSLTQRIRILEQLLLLSVIVGRWLMPREGLSRDQLSQLLLINIGTAADILELFEAFSEQEVRSNDFLRTVILCLWQASLIQFCFNKTAVRDPPNNRSLQKSSGSIGSSRSLIDRKNSALAIPIQDVREESVDSEDIEMTRKRSHISVNQFRSVPDQTQPTTSRSTSVAPVMPPNLDCLEAQEEPQSRCPCFSFASYFCHQRPCLCCETELWAIGMSLMLQDLPFLCLRLTLIIYFNVRSYSNIFFTCKNTLLIMLQVFRSIVIVSETYARRNAGMDAESLRNSNR